MRDDAIVSCDSGTIATWWARQIPAKRGQMYSLLRHLATMAHGLPYAIAAQIAYPDRQCVAFVGDGGFSMLMAEFATCVKYKLPIKVFVIKNNTLGQIKWEQMVFLGNPEYGCELQPDRLRRVRASVRRHRLHHRRSGRLRQHPRPGSGHAGPGARRGRGRSVRAADAAEGHPGTGGPLRRIARARRAEPKKIALTVAVGQSARDDLSRDPWRGLSGLAESLRHVNREPVRAGIPQRKTASPNSRNAAPAPAARRLRGQCPARAQPSEFPGEYATCTALPSG